MKPLQFEVKNSYISFTRNGIFSSLRIQMFDIFFKIDNAFPFFFPSPFPLHNFVSKNDILKYKYIINCTSLYIYGLFL